MSKIDPHREECEYYPDLPLQVLRVDRAEAWKERVEEAADRKDVFRDRSDNSTRGVGMHRQVRVGGGKLQKIVSPEATK